MKEKIKTTKLDEMLLDRIKNSILNATGNDWKKEWTNNINADYFNGMTGRPFTSSKTIFLMTLYTNYLKRENEKNGINEPISNRWFSATDAIKHNLFKPKKMIKVIDKNGNEKETFEKEKIHAYNEIPLFKLFYKDNLTDKIKYYSVKDKSGRSYYSLFLTQVFKGIDDLQKLGINRNDIYMSKTCNLIYPFYHESQLDPEKIKNLKLPEFKGIKHRKMDEVNLDLFNDIKNAIELNDIVFDSVKSKNGAFYVPSEDKIFLPSKESFKNVESLYATAFHELGHSTGNEKRLKRQIQNPFGSPEYAKEELVAEITSILLCNEYSIHSDKQMQNNGEYLKNWLQAVKDEKSTDEIILEAFNKATKADHYIMNKLEQYKGKEIDINKSVELENSNGVNNPISVQESLNENGFNPVEIEQEKEFEDVEIELIR